LYALACCKLSTNTYEKDNRSKKTYAYKKNKIHCYEETPHEMEKFKQLQIKIRAMPEDIRLYIVSYIARPQSQFLLRDIRNFYQTYLFLLNVICRGDKNVLLDRIFTVYDMSLFYKNMNPIVRGNIRKWQVKRRNTEVIDDFVIVEFPNALNLFYTNEKSIFLWGVLSPFYRSRYINFLYSVIDTETDELEPIHLPTVVPIGIYIGLPTNMLL
jgi:hypothetical protein